jgi:PKD repeat protein
MRYWAGFGPAMPVTVKNERLPGICRRTVSLRGKPGGDDMTAMKISGLVLLALLLLIPWCSAGSVQAQSTTALPAQPFITINPIGNQTIDNVFFITGTTNLPASNNSLLIQIETANFNPAGWGSDYRSNVSIQPGEQGVNLWSCNVTTDRWVTFPGPEPDAVPGDYIVMIASISSLGDVEAQSVFTLTSNSTITPSHRLQSYTPPVASFAYGYGETTPSEMTAVTVDFIDASKNSPTSWLWSFGDGNSSTSQYPHHTYARAGTYTVFLTATNAAGSNTTGLSVNIPTVNGRATPTVITTQETPLQVDSSVASSTRWDIQLPRIVWPLDKEELSKINSTVHLALSKDVTDYINAPSITGIQKIDALRIASTSTLDSHLSSGADAGAIHKKFGDYLKSSHGPITIEWAYPYTGIIRLSMPVGNLSSNEYGLAYALVNIDTQSILSEGFVDWHKYW